MNKFLDFYGFILSFWLYKTYYPIIISSLYTKINCNNERTRTKKTHNSNTIYGDDDAIITTQY
jgi:hypothetical protein